MATETIDTAGRFEEHSPLTLVREGMTVADWHGREVGTVRSVFIGNTGEVARDRGLGPATAPPENHNDTLLGDLLAVSGAGSARAPELRQRLRRTGFVRIDATGLFSGDRYATLDEIARVEMDRVILSVAGDDLPQD